MNSYMFDTLVDALKRNDSSDHKMYLMKIMIGRSGMISTSQVAQLLKFLPSENDKLELAKMAHGHTIDRDSYDGIVNKALSSNDTKAILNGFIHRYR